MARGREMDNMDEMDEMIFPLRDRMTYLLSLFLRRLRYSRSVNPPSFSKALA